MITKNALRQLEQKANSGIVQPTVCVLTGDVNLTEELTTDVVQPDVGEPDLVNHWHTETSNERKSGDVAFVKGTSSKPFDVSIGVSYRDRGMRHDQHDFFGMTLKVPLVQDPSTLMPPPGLETHQASASGNVLQRAAVESTQVRTGVEQESQEKQEENPTTDEGKPDERTETTSSGVLQPAATESTEDRRGLKRESHEQQTKNRKPTRANRRHRKVQGRSKNACPNQGLPKKAR